MAKNRFASLLLLSAIAVLATALPAHAEFVWNPFDHMTPGDGVLVIFLCLFMIFMALVGWPLLISALTYWALSHKYPEVGTRFKTVFIYTYAAYVVGWILSSFIPMAEVYSPWYTASLYLGLIINLGIIIGGAVLGYFRKTKQA